MIIAKDVSGLGAIDCGAITSSGTISGKTSLTLDTKTVTSNELGVLAGAKSGAAIAGKALVASDNTKDVSGLGAIDCGAITSSGTISGKTSLTLDTKTVTSNELGVLAGAKSGAAIAGKALVASDNTKDVSGLGAIDCGAITSSGTISGKTSLTLDDTTLTESELAVLDGVSAGTAKASKALVLGSSKNVSGLGTVGCGAITSTGSSFDFHNPSIDDNNESKFTFYTGSTDKTDNSKRIEIKNEEIYLQGLF